MIAESCSKKWDVSKKEVLDLWEANKIIAAEFGTAIHNAMEFWEKNKKLGQKISKERGLSGIKNNYALPKHPLLKSIILDFERINKIKGEVLTEVLVTDTKNGLCGRADRIVVTDWNKKICSIGDYKINIGSEEVKSSMKASPPFDNLQSTKISKYQIQMSIYANMMESAGWTVEKLVVYVYESRWKVFELEVLNVLNNEKN